MVDEFERRRSTDCREELWTDVNSSHQLAHKLLNLGWWHRIQTVRLKLLHRIHDVFWLELYPRWVIPSLTNVILSVFFIVIPSKKSRRRRSESRVGLKRKVVLTLSHEQAEISLINKASFSVTRDHTASAAHGMALTRRSKKSWKHLRWLLMANKIR